MAGAAADVLCIFTVLRISERPEQSLLHDLGETDNGIHRRAQLMAHRREEGRLGVVRPLGLVAGDATLPLLVLCLASIYVVAADSMCIPLRYLSPEVRAPA